MTDTALHYGDLHELLRKPASDATVRHVIGGRVIARNAHLGFLEFVEAGVSMVFAEAPWVVPSSEIDDPRILRVSAFHFHREGHEGYCGYPGNLPGGVLLGEPEAELVRKLGPPTAVGGGGIGSVLKRPIPRWTRYASAASILQFQIDPSGLTEMATLCLPEVPLTP